MVNLVIAFFLIFSVLSVWLIIQTCARKFALLHPELGPAREDGSECGDCHLCDHDPNKSISKLSYKKEKTPCT